MFSCQSKSKYSYHYNEVKGLFIIIETINNKRYVDNDQLYFIYLFNIYTSMFEGIMSSSNLVAERSLCDPITN